MYKQPLHFTAPDLDGKLVWAVTLDPNSAGHYDVEARIGQTRWRGFSYSLRPIALFSLYARDGNETEQGTFKTLRDLAQFAASIARGRERNRIAIGLGLPGTPTAATLTLVDRADQGVCPEGHDAFLVSTGGIAATFSRQCVAGEYVGLPLIREDVTAEDIVKAAIAYADPDIIAWAFSTIADRNDIPDDGLLTPLAARGPDDPRDAS